MATEKTTKLLQEYQANVELWKHDDNLRQQRNGTFLNMNTILLVALGTFVNIAPTITNAAISGLLISVFGLPICFMWNSVQQRNSEYIRFRRYILRSIEAQLPTLTTFTKQWKALNKHEKIEFQEIKESFTVIRGSKISSTLTEGRLPIVVAVFWSIILISSIVTLALIGFKLL